MDDFTDQTKSSEGCKIIFCAVLFIHNKKLGTAKNFQVLVAIRFLE